MPTQKPIPKLHSFLAEKGLLQTNDTVSKAAAIKEYWNCYYRNWQKQKRDTQHSYRIFLDATERQLINDAASITAMPVTMYIKQAALAYTTHTPIRNNSKELDAIRQMLSTAISTIIYAIDEERINTNDANGLIEKVDRLHDEIIAIAHNTMNDDNKSIK